MTRYAVYDTAPLATQARESAKRGKQVFLCGRMDPKCLGEVEATNAANAILAGIERWPHIPTRQLTARKITARGEDD